jgi:four helix bundle protein
MKNYKDLIVWQKAHAFALAAYKTSKSFPKEEQYNLTSQLRRAATSIPTNLGEGCGKFTQRDLQNIYKTPWALLRKLNISFFYLLN